MSIDPNVSAWLSNPTFQKLLAAVVAVLIVIAARQLVLRALSRNIEDRDARYRARKMITFAAYGAVVLALLFVFSDRLGGLTIALGVAGAGVAFALQEVIASVAGWLAVSFGGFYKVGDRIQLGGIKGDVIDIGILRTTLMECGEWIQADIYSGRVVRITNSFVFKEPVFNYSGDFPFLWDEVRVPVKYGGDRAEARRLLARAAEDVVGAYASEVAEAWGEITMRYRLEDAVLEPQVTLIANDNWMEYTLRYPVHYRSRRVVKDRLFSRILEEIDATGGKVALASATFHLVEAPELTVNVRQEADR